MQLIDSEKAEIRRRRMFTLLEVIQAQSKFLSTSIRG